MGDKLVRKGFAIGIIVLFMCVTVTPTIGISNFIDDTTSPVTTHKLSPSEPDGLNGWYVSDVVVTLNATDDISGVKEIKYQIDEGPVETITGNKGTFFVSTDSTMHTIKYWAIDNAGNVEQQHTINFKLDENPPKIYLTREKKEKDKSLLYKFIWNSNSLQYLFNFTANATDATSGMERVEFYLNGVLNYTVYGPGPEYKWSIYLSNPSQATFRAYAYDFAGLSAFADYADPTLSVTIIPGFFLFKNLILPNKYIGYIGRYFIWATSSNP